MRNHPNSKFLKNPPKGVPLRQVAVMKVDEGEEVLGGYVTPHIPQIEIYKLLAKKRKNGTREWAHFVQRDNIGNGKERVEVY